MLESRRGSGIRKVLRSAAPTCPEVVRACQLASRQILRGEDCCRLFFKQFRYQPEGYCIEGEHEVPTIFAKLQALNSGKIADKDEASAFPLGPDIQVIHDMMVNLYNTLECRSGKVMEIVRCFATLSFGHTSSVSIMKQ